jgi:hypothetical protein
MQPKLSAPHRSHQPVMEKKFWPNCGQPRLPIQARRPVVRYLPLPEAVLNILDEFLLRPHPTATLLSNVVFERGNLVRLDKSEIPEMWIYKRYETYEEDGDVDFILVYDEITGESEATVEIEAVRHRRLRTMFRNERLPPRAHPLARLLEWVVFARTNDTEGNPELIIFPSYDTPYHTELPLNPMKCTYCPRTGQPRNAKRNRPPDYYYEGKWPAGSTFERIKLRKLEKVRDRSETFMDIAELESESESDSDSSHDSDFYDDNYY